MNTAPTYSNKLSRHKNQSGLTLIEILVTVVISSIGLMGLAALQLQAREATNDSGNRSQAIWLFNDITSRIHANEGSSLSYVTALPPYACPASAPKACTTYNTGTTTITAENCNGAEMAAWDLYEVACGSPKVDGYFGNSVTYLPSAELSISCVVPAGCDNGHSLKVELKWKAKLDTETVTGNTRTATSGDLTLSDIITP